MKTIIEILFYLLLFSSLLFTQEKKYWIDAPVDGNKMYTLLFTNNNEGYAFTIENHIFRTTDAGKCWNYTTLKLVDLDKINVLWKTDIYCSVMQSVDGGENWEPYSGERQEHFCKVYLKDPNVDYKIAADFLSKVTEDIFNKISNNRLDDIINHPVQCTEYFCNESEGWALGWCIRNFEGKTN